MKRSLGTAVAVAALVLATSAPAHAEGNDDPLSVTVTVDGRPVTGSTVPIYPGRPVALLITAQNDGEIVQRVSSVRFVGTVLGLTFFAYDTALPFDVAPHASQTRTLVIPLADLPGQVTGLLPASIELLDADAGPLGGVDTVTEVHGSVWSLYGLFGIGALLLTLLFWTVTLLAFVHDRLPAVRWRRGLRFLPAGIGTGLVVVIGLSVFRVAVPAPGMAVAVVLGSAAAGLLLGCLTSAPIDGPGVSDMDDADNAAELTVGTTAGVLLFDGHEPELDDPDEPDTVGETEDAAEPEPDVHPRPESADDAADSADAGSEERV